MLYVQNDGTIKLTKGDTARLTVSIMNATTDAAYEMSPDDEISLTVKRAIQDTEYILQKTITGSNQIHIKPDDTNNLECGKYKYDVQLTTSSGDVYTVIEPSKFEITPGVTD